MQEETSVSNNGISQQNAGNAQPIYGASKVSEKIITDEASDVKKKDREYLEAGETQSANRKSRVLQGDGSLIDVYFWSIWKSIREPSPCIIES